MFDSSRTREVELLDTVRSADTWKGERAFGEGE